MPAETTIRLQLRTDDANMLVLCYGLTKSGSTLTFELIKGMLNSAGHAQDRLPDGPVNPGHRVNYVQPLTRKRLNEVLSAVGDRWIAVKTHSGIADPLVTYVEELQSEGKLQLVVSYRDPRDICLSMLDAGKAARASGAKEFSEVTDLDVAATRLAEQSAKFFKWAAVRGALLLDFETVAFDPETAMDRIEKCLGLHVDRVRAKKYAFEEAFTQKNKAQRNRFLSELTEQQQVSMNNTFATFIANFIDGDPSQWLSEQRREIMRREALRLESIRATAGQQGLQAKNR
jgi:hypothetical protein